MIRLQSKIPMSAPTPLLFATNTLLSTSPFSPGRYPMMLVLRATKPIVCLNNIKDMFQNHQKLIPAQKSYIQVYSSCPFVPNTCTHVQTNTLRECDVQPWHVKRSTHTKWKPQKYCAAHNPSCDEQWWENRRRLSLVIKSSTEPHKPMLGLLTYKKWEKPGCEQPMRRKSFVFFNLAQLLPENWKRCRFLKTCFKGRINMPRPII